jgi:hypothetical protein
LPKRAHTQKILCASESFPVAILLELAGLNPSVLLVLGQKQAE